MTKRKRVAIQLSREQVARLLYILAAGEPGDVPLWLKLKAAEKRFGDPQPEA